MIRRYQALRPVAIPRPLQIASPEAHGRMAEEIPNLSAEQAPTKPGNRTTLLIATRTSHLNPFWKVRPNFKTCGGRVSVSVFNMGATRAARLASKSTCPPFC